MQKSRLKPPNGFKMPSKCRLKSSNGFKTRFKPRLIRPHSLRERSKRRLMTLPGLRGHFKRDLKALSGLPGADFRAFQPLVECRKRISASSSLLPDAGNKFPRISASCRMGRKYACSVWKIKMRPARTDGTHCENEKRYGERILLTQQGCARTRRAGKRFYSTPPRSF